MMAKNKPLVPIKPELSKRAEISVGLMAIVQIMLWPAMVLAGIHVLLYWAHTLYFKGILDPTAVQYSIFVAIGAYFCLIVDKSKIYKALNINQDLPYLNAHLKKQKKGRK